MTDSRKKLRIGLIGAGGRGVGGYVRYFDQAPVPAELVAIADPSRENVEACLAAIGRQSSRPNVYMDWSEMLQDESRLDGVIIATPNFLHYEPALACLDKGVRAIALEKPLATSPDECREIVSKADERSVPIQLGFVFRSAPFFSKVKQLLSNGTVGKVVSIQLDELVSPRTTAVNFRGPWRRYAAKSGGSLLEKSCHDMDLLNWMAGSRPKRVSSFGGKSIFRANGFLPDKCDANCPMSDRCVYLRERDNMKFRGGGKVDDVCIYNSGADVIDHQSVQVYYENDVICNFMLNFNTDGERSGRNLHVVGTRGRVWGRESGAVVMSHDLATNEVTEHPLVKDDSPHAGGNRRHAEEFLRLAAGSASEPVASAYDAYLSAMLCFAADRSRVEGRQVMLEYPHRRRIELY